MSFVIAVDGPAASGKGTVASRLAQVYGLPFLETDLLYRAVGFVARMRGRGTGSHSVSASQSSSPLKV